MKNRNLIWVLMAVFAACQSKPESTPPPNIILMIGDGMGLSQISSAFYFQEDSSNFYQFNHIGLIQTSSTTKITDSAAGTTAFSSGVLTYNGAIGVDADTTVVRNIVEILSDRGWNTGLIATSSIQHATPASFYSHVKSRNMYEEISADLVNSSIDFFAGGGLRYFVNRTDSINYLDKLGEMGFEWDTTAFNAQLDPTKKYGFLLADTGMPRMLDGRGDFLPKASKAAIDYFDKAGKPFFLMIEGSQIDWGGHGNDADYLISEMIDFDKAVGVALDYAKAQGNTIVIVTADHETGGFTLAANRDYTEIAPSFSTRNHSTTLIPVFAFGPQAHRFMGIYKNTAIFNKMMQIVDQSANEKN